MATIPQLTGMHDGLALIQARQALRQAFAQLLLNPGAESALREPIQAAIAALHVEHVERFGWRDAEVIRGEAFADAIENTIPVGDATESDFGALEGGAA